VTGHRGSELHKPLREKLARRFSDAGWVADVAFDFGPDSLSDGAFRRQIAHDFWVMANFMGWWDAKAGSLRVMGVVGVSYFPAYCLWPRLIGRERAEVTIGVAELAGSPNVLGAVELNGPEDVPRAAEQLVATVLEQGMEWARQYASVDALIEYWTEASDFEGEIQAVPVLLAGSGRVDDARSELSTYLASGREEIATPAYRRFCHKFNRWLDAGAVIPEPPTGPVGPRMPRRETPTREEMATKTRVRRDARDAVRRMSGGKNRDQLREMLKSEFDRRGAKEGPIAIEMMLDTMGVSDSLFGRARLTASGLKVARDYTTGLYKFFRDLESWKSPEWLEPPERASYDMRGDQRNLVGVDLDPAAEVWLNQVVDGAPTITSDIASVSAWLAWDPEPQVAASRLAVHIGAERVGALVQADVAQFQSAMDSAAHSDELPFTHASLWRRKSPPKFVLEIWAPKED
jgi:hypothetical protein